MLTTAFVFITSNRIELKDPAWINICQYVSQADDEFYIVGGYNPDAVPETIETYSKINERHLNEWPKTPSVLLNSGYRDIFYLKYANVNETIKVLNEEQRKNAIVIGKLCPGTMIVKTAENMDPEKDFDNVCSSVNFRFIEVEYKCGEMLGFSIDIPESHYIAGNEILSKTYILRHLEHLPIYVRWFHNSSYILKIVDENMNVITLNCNKYIRLNSDGYVVVDTTETPSIPANNVLEEFLGENNEERRENIEKVNNTDSTLEEYKDEMKTGSDTDAEEYQMVQNQ